MENTIHLQEKEYLNKYRLLCKYQSGFCNHQFTDVILKGKSQRRNNDMIVVDLQTAFGMIDHKINKTNK